MRDSRRGRPTLDVFCHIPKTGGMTFHHMLRRYFGGSHLEGLPRSGRVYDALDLKRDLAFMPGLRSLGGHGMRPFVDFGDFSDRLRWYTILRDPVPRTVSNYQHQVEKMGLREDLLTWLAHPHNRNWSVRMLAGGQDLEAAKRALDAFACVGFMDRYNEFLLLLRERLEWRGFNVTYRRIRNPARAGSVRDRIMGDPETYGDALAEANALDLQLYAYAREVVYPRQVAEYGERRLAGDLEREYVEPRERTGEKARVWTFRFVNRIVYPALVKLDRRPRTVASAG